MPETVGPNQPPEADATPNTGGNEAGANQTGSDTAETATTIEQQEQLPNVEQIIKDTQEREEARLVERYGEGLTGKLRGWLNRTEIGRWVKIGGKMVAAGAAGVIATSMTGGLGLIAAPLVYSLGFKAAAEGVIETGQYLLKGDGLRRDLEAAKIDLLQTRAKEMGDLKELFDKKEITQDEYQAQLQGMLTELADAEENVIKMESANIKWEAKQKMIRGIAGSVATLAFGFLHGIPLGMQNFDTEKAKHLVTFSRHGFDFLYKAGEVASTTGGAHHIFGGLAHEVGTRFGVPLLGKIGVGTAAIGLLYKTYRQWRGAREDMEVAKGLGLPGGSEPGSEGTGGAGPSDGGTAEPTGGSAGGASVFEDAGFYDGGQYNPDDEENTEEEEGEEEDFGGWGPEPGPAEPTAEPEPQPAEPAGEPADAGAGQGPQPEQEPPQQEPPHEEPPNEQPPHEEPPPEEETTEQMNERQRMKKVKENFEALLDTSIDLLTWFGKFEALNLPSIMELLILEPGFTKDQLSKSYRKAAKTIHPELIKGSRRAEDILKYLNLAREKLREQAV